uniref:Uncharacterized protein n=1 Tax=Anguilla anguilla TaxID=7936 RepID=A0A0E9VCA1_ANGAN
MLNHFTLKIMIHNNSTVHCPRSEMR